MKKFLLFVCLSLVLTSSVLAAPSDLDSEDNYDFVPIEDEVPSIKTGGGVDPADLLEDALIIENLEIITGSDIPAGSEITDITVMSLSPIGPDDVTGLKSILLSVIGEYDPIIIEYEYESSNGYTNYLREVQPDYVWLCSVGLFALIIYCIFRLGGALIRD